MEATVHEPQEQGVAVRLWNKFKNKSAFSKYSPFMICLASGDLDYYTFCNYTVQDASFIEAFPEVLETVEEWIGKDGIYAVGFGALRNSVQSMMVNIHNSFVTGFSFDISDSEVDNCKNFLLETASPNDDASPSEKMKAAAYTIGAMMPCLKLHICLSKELIWEILDPNERNQLCQKWINNYSSESFEVATLQTENLLDQLSISFTQKELEVLEKTYHRAMQFEMNALSAQKITQETVVPLSGKPNLEGRHLLIFSDFDLTCTTVGSSDTLAEMIICIDKKWDTLREWYKREYENWIDKILSGEKVKGFNYEGLCKTLEQLSSVETIVNSGVIGSKFLSGLSLEDIRRAGEHLKLQDGCIHFFQRIVNKADVHMLSECWCGDLIRSAFSSVDLDCLSVHANEFTYKESISTGGIITNVESPKDKVQVFKSIVKKGDTYLSVYIGDSVSDLLCLLEADVGIVIGSNSNIRKMGNQFGVSFVPLFSGLVKKQREHVEGRSFNWKGLSGILYTVSNWAEIHAFILGQPKSS